MYSHKTHPHGATLYTITKDKYELYQHRNGESHSALRTPHLGRGAVKKRTGSGLNVSSYKHGSYTGATDVTGPGAVGRVGKGVAAHCGTLALARESYHENSRLARHRGG